MRKATELAGDGVGIGTLGCSGFGRWWEWGALCQLPALPLPWFPALSPGPAFPQSVPSAHRALLSVSQRPAEHHRSAECGCWLLCVPGCQCGWQHPGQGPAEGKRRYVRMAVSQDPWPRRKWWLKAICFSWILHNMSARGGVCS